VSEEVEKKSADDLVADLRAWVEKLMDDIGPPVKEKDWRVSWEVFRSWEARVANYLLKVGAPEIHDALAKAKSTIVAADEKGNLRRALRAKAAVIDEFADAVEKDPTVWEKKNPTEFTSAKTGPTVAGIIPAEERPNVIVHGSESAMREEIGRFLEELGCKPLIESDPAEDDRTGFDRFVERSLTAAFAIILLIGDEEGRRRARPQKPAGALQARASQDAILRLGYLAGLLGKRRVVALTSGKLSIPANLLGITALSYELADWRSKIAEALTSSIRTRV
jgi:predicted nucleotide-binding protein